MILYNPIFVNINAASFLGGVPGENQKIKKIPEIIKLNYQVKLFCS